MKRLLPLLLLSHISHGYQLFPVPPMYAPWRENYLSKHITQKASKNTSQECPFCGHDQSNDNTKYHILLKTKHCFIKMNEFPYSKGHILIIPYQHTGELHKLPPHVRTELMEIATASSLLIKQTYNCTGFNIGFNLGDYSGASIPDHIHLQVVPRYKSSLSFMHTIGNSDVICYDIEKVYENLFLQFQNLIPLN